jgi:hypothetical protein
MDRRIAGFYQDEERFWVAELKCGHKQHVRHKPLMTLRPWVNNEIDRKERLKHLFHAKLATLSHYSWGKDKCH